MMASGQMPNFNGKGALQLLDGTKVDGYWKDGVFMGAQNTTYSLSGNKPAINQSTAEVVKPKLKVWAVIIGVASYRHMPNVALSR